MAQGWPTENDLTDLLTAGGMVASTPTLLQQLLDLGGAISAAIAEWEQRTYWQPFLANTETVRYAYDRIRTPANSVPLLDLAGGFTSISAVRVGVSSTNAGTLLAADSDYVLQPDDAPNRNKPYTWIEFWRSLSLCGVEFAGPIGAPSRIEVTGTRGYCSAIPQDVFQAVLRRAASIVLPELGAALTGGALQFAEGDVKEVYAGAHAFATIADAYQAQFDRSVKAYRRLIL